jgi:hypothetical protein
MERLVIADLDLLRFQIPKPPKAQFGMLPDTQSRGPSPDYFATAACPMCSASVKPRSPAEPLDEDRSMSAFYVCTGRDHHQLAVVMSGDPPYGDAHYELVHQGN